MIPPLRATCRLALQVTRLALLFASCEAFVAVILVAAYENIDIEKAAVWIHALAIVLAAVVVALWMRSGADDDGRLQLPRDWKG